MASPSLPIIFWSYFWIFKLLSLLLKTNTSNGSLNGFPIKSGIFSSPITILCSLCDNIKEGFTSFGSKVLISSVSLKESFFSFQAFIYSSGISSLFSSLKSLISCWIKSLLLYSFSQILPFFRGIFISTFSLSIDVIPIVFILSCSIIFYIYLLKRLIISYIVSNLNFKFIC